MISQVEIGGGTNYTRVGIYTSSDIHLLNTMLQSVIVQNITSADEYR